MKTDGSSRKMGEGVRIVLQSPKNIIISWVVWFAFQATKNEAEYEALVLGIRLALSMFAEDLEAFNVSQLVVSQVNDHYETKDSRMTSYLSLVMELVVKL